MKTIKMSLFMVILLGSAMEMVAGKSKGAAPQVKGTYAELEDQYKALEKSFEALEDERAKFVAKNPSLDELAQSKLDEKIATLRQKADAIYTEMGEFPQFSTSHVKVIPASPKYMSTKEYKECIMKSKKVNTDVKKLTTSLSKKK